MTITLDQAQAIYDGQMPDESNICLRCEEEEADYGEDYCEYCEDTIREQNRSKFQAQEGY